MPNDSKSINNWSSAYLAVCPGSTSTTGWRGLRNSGGARWATVTCSCWASFCTSSSPVTHSDNHCYMHRLPLSYIYIYICHVNCYGDKPLSIQSQSMLHAVLNPCYTQGRPLLHARITAVTYSYTSVTSGQFLLCWDCVEQRPPVTHSEPCYILVSDRPSLNKI